MIDQETNEPCVIVEDAELALALLDATNFVATSNRPEPQFKGVPTGQVTGKEFDVESTLPPGVGGVDPIMQDIDDADAELTGTAPRHIAQHLMNNDELSWEDLDIFSWISDANTGGISSRDLADMAERKHAQFLASWTVRMRKAFRTIQGLPDFDDMFIKDVVKGEGCTWHVADEHRRLAKEVRSAWPDEWPEKE
jgi:hypothetical protein